VRRPTVKPVRNSRDASLPSSSNASAVPYSEPPWTKSGGMVIARFSSMARAAPCPSPPALQDAFGQPTVQRLGCGFPVVHLLGLFHAGTGVLLKLVVAPLLTHDRAQVQQVHPM
jgi:hypothetical protein